MSDATVPVDLREEMPCGHPFACRVPLEGTIAGALAFRKDPQAHGVCRACEREGALTARLRAAEARQEEAEDVVRSLLAGEVHVRRNLGEPLEEIHETGRVRRAKAFLEGTTPPKPGLRARLRAAEAERDEAREDAARHYERWAAARDALAALDPFRDYRGRNPADIMQEIGTALARSNALRAAVALHHGQKADDRCIEDDDRLYAAAGLPPCDRRVGDKADMLENCRRFIDQRCEGGGWPTYRELEADRDALRRELDGLRAESERVRQATGKIRHTDHADCVGCGCIALTAEEAVVALRRELDGLREAVGPVVEALESFAAGFSDEALIFEDEHLTAGQLRRLARLARPG